jgi:hypothetical protein
MTEELEDTVRGTVPRREHDALRDVEDVQSARLARSEMPG